MSEFKFACPVCGQHLTAADTGSGSQIECPTCFRKIVVPQAPANGDSKFILAASQVGAPKTSAAASGAGLTRPKSSFGSLILAVVWAGLLLATAVGVYLFRDRILRWAHLGPAPAPPTKAVATPVRPPISPYPVPTSTSWTLDLQQAVIPPGQAVGRIGGNGFLCEAATLTGSALSLRQGQQSPPDFAFGVLLPARPGEDLSGKTFLVPPASQSRGPRLVLRWKNDLDQVQKLEFSSGYALKVTFGQTNSGGIPGKIYLSAPDEKQSFVAGEFVAEIRKIPQHSK